MALPPPRRPATESRIALVNTAPSAASPASRHTEPPLRIARACSGAREIGVLHPEVQQRRLVRHVDPVRHRILNDAHVKAVRDGVDRGGPDAPGRRHAGDDQRSHTQRGRPHESRGVPWRALA